MKQCTKCKQWKDESEFNKKKASKDGLRTECRICQCNYNKNYYKTPDGKQKHLNYMNLHKDYYVNFERNYAYRRSELYKQNKLNRYVSLNLCHSIKNFRNFDLVSSYLNFTYEQFCQHLESLFIPPMSWDNYGSYWEIDHIIPQNMFNIISSDDHDFKICWSLMNLRPLEKSLNRQRPRDGSDVSEELKQKILGQVV